VIDFENSEVSKISVKTRYMGEGVIFSQTKDENNTLKLTGRDATGSKFKAKIFLGQTEGTDPSYIPGRYTRLFGIISAKIRCH
jgi:hypothetical protein